MDISTTLYGKLLVVIPNLKAVQQHTKLTADGYIDLQVDILSRANDTARIAIAHNYTQNGDVIADPDMEILVDFKHQTAEAKTYQNLYIYTEVEDGDDDLQTELNQFLDMWLDNLIEQGHKQD
jgi:uncharacterized protein YqiB (DUF1249 family)